MPSFTVNNSPPAAASNNLPLGGSAAEINDCILNSTPVINSDHIVLEKKYFYFFSKIRAVDFSLYS